MSDTPRMKAAQMAAMEYMTGDVYSVGCEIERELNVANERIKRLEEMYEGEIGENEQFLGSNLQGLLTRELNWSKDRIKRLEEAGDVLAERADHLGLWPMAIKGWNKAKEDKP